MLISGFCTPKMHWHTTDGMQRTARIHLESLSYSSPTAHSLVSGCRCLEVTLSAVVIPRVLRMRANLSLICLNIRVAECSKNATLISVSETPASDLHQDVSRNASTTRAKYSTGVKVTRTTITYERQDHHF